MIGEDEFSEKTKQVTKEGSDPIEIEIISDNQNGGASTAEKGKTILVQVNQIDGVDTSGSILSPKRNNIPEEDTPNKKPPVKKTKDG